MSICTIVYYPVKSLPGQTLSQINLIKHRPISDDRRFAIEKTPPNKDLRPWRKKSYFLNLAQCPSMAHVLLDYSQEDRLMTLSHCKRQVTTDPIASTGKKALSHFFASLPFVANNVAFVESADQPFQDRTPASVSIVSKATLVALSEVVNTDVDILRLRANISIDGIAPFSELSFIGKRLILGDAILDVHAPIQRCPTININPATGTVDVNLLKQLGKNSIPNHIGILARVVRGGTITTSTPLDIQY